ncbi:unnamed protein product [Prunus armeniaca]|uniref:Dirigent protein n=2 Tax=Prunus armeniaca TaxID=36596 RepID=A0A6J5WPE7_PRUAR|nr:unnamed protein product [Prunus armeniaca]
MEKVTAATVYYIVAWPNIMAKRNLGFGAKDRIPMLQQLHKNNPCVRKSDGLLLLKKRDVEKSFQGANLTLLAPQFHFGNIAVFHDPITLDNNLHSKPVGMAQGIYIYDTKNTFTAWLDFSFSLNSTDYQGSINFIGADPILIKTRDISVVGGIGDFFMHRGIAAINTDAYEGEEYFMLKVDIKFYECW